MPKIGLLVGGLGVMVMLIVSPDGAGAVSGASISPETLSSSGQKFEVTYSGRITKEQGANLMVEECVADDRKADFDPTSDCSALSRQYFFGLPESGTVTYGGQRASNPTAPFIGLDPENQAWSVCGPEAGPGNYQSGYFRISESPAELNTDVFVPFTCAVAGARAPATADDSDATGAVVAAGAGAVALAGAVGIVHKRRRRTSSFPSR